MGEISPALYRAGTGEPVVLLHGFTGTWMHWRPVLADLAARYEVIAPTLAGHAGGPPFPGGAPLTLATAADHLEDHLHDLGVPYAHLVGNSMGGALALELAARGRARSVVALSPGGGWLPESAEARRVAKFFARQVGRTRMAAPRLGRVMSRPLMRRAALREVMCRGDLVPPADALELALSSLECTVVDDVLQTLRVGGGVTPQRLESIDAPVLIAWAERDRVLPFETCSARFIGSIPDSEVRILRGVGHVPMWDAPGLVVETIVHWVERNSVGAPTERLG
jgi:pimeloyl-ACP methyl ester carboxylesterase